MEYRCYKHMVNGNEPCSLCKKEREESGDARSKISDVHLLQEFRKRFSGSVLFECDTTPLLASIGLDRIKRYLDENHGLTVRNKRKAR
jgi:hypothetical protein